MAHLKDSEVNGILHASEDVQIGNISVIEKLDKLNADIESNNTNINTLMTNTINDTEGWIFLGNGCYYKVKNGICTITGVSYNDFMLSANNYTTVAIIPIEISPSIPVWFTPNSLGGTDASLVGYVENGMVNIFCLNNQAFWSFSVTYPI